MKKVTRRKGLIFEIAIVTLIALCVIFMNFFTLTKIRELEDIANDTIFIKDDLPFIESEDLGEELKEYLPIAYKMVEIYDPNYQLLFQLNMNSEPKLDNVNILEYPNIQQMIKSSMEGQSRVLIGDSEENVYFKWIKNSEGDERLIIIYSPINKVKGLWVFSLTSYLILILVFILIIRVHTNSYNEKIKEYTESTINISNSMRKKR